MNLLNPQLSLFLYGLCLSLWCFSLVSVNYNFQLFQIKGKFVLAQNNSKCFDWALFKEQEERGAYINLVRAIKAQYLLIHMALKPSKESNELLLTCFQWNQICHEQRFVGYSKDVIFICFYVHIGMYLQESANMYFFYWLATFVILVILP